MAAKEVWRNVLEKGAEDIIKGENEQKTLEGVRLAIHIHNELIWRLPFIEWARACEAGEKRAIARDLEAHLYRHLGENPLRVADLLEEDLLTVRHLEFTNIALARFKLRLAHNGHEWRVIRPLVAYE